MTIDRSWKQRIVEGAALDAVKVPHSERVMPPFTLPQPGVPFAPRALRTPLIDRLESAPDGVDPAELGPQLVSAVRSGGGHDLLPFAGQSAALVHDIAPAAEIVRRRVPGSSRTLAEQAARVVERLRGLDLQKRPGIAETIDWVAALELLGIRTVDAETVDRTLGSVLKYVEDQDLARAAGLSVEHAP